MALIKVSEKNGRKLELNDQIFGRYFIAYWKDGKIIFSRGYMTMKRAEYWFGKYSEKYLKS